MDLSVLLGLGQRDRPYDINNLAPIQSPNAPADPGDPAPGPDVNVTAQRPRELREDPREVPSERRMGEELIKRKGMFGMKGTLRDVVGLLGDSFLMGQGGPAIYRAQREKEKLASAMYDFTSDPMEAAERVALENPQLGYDIYRNAQEFEGKKEARDLEIQTRKAAADLQRLRTQEQAHSLAGRIAGTITDDRTYQKFRGKLQDVLARGGIADVLPDTYDKETIDAIFNQSLDTDDTIDNRRADRNTDSQIAARSGQLSVSRQRASQSAADASARRAEQARHNRRNEGLASERNDISRNRPVAGKKPGLIGRILPPPRRVVERFVKPIN